MAEEKTVPVPLAPNDYIVATTCVTGRDSYGYGMKPRRVLGDPAGPFTAYSDALSRAQSSEWGATERLILRVVGIVKAKQHTTYDIVQGEPA